MTAETPLLKAEKADVSDTMTQRAVAGTAGVRPRYEPPLLPGARRTGHRHQRSQRTAARHLPSHHRRPVLGRHLLPVGRHRQPRFRARRASHHAQPRFGCRVEDHDHVLRRRIRPGQPGYHRLAYEVRHQHAARQRSSSIDATSTAPRAIPSPRPNPLSAPAASSFRPPCGTSSADRSADPFRRTRPSILATIRPTASITARRC